MPPSKIQLSNIMPYMQQCSLPKFNSLILCLVYATMPPSKIQLSNPTPYMQQGKGWLLVLYGAMRKFHFSQDKRTIMLHLTLKLYKLSGSVMWAEDID